MPKAETSLVDEILDVEASRKHGPACWTCANVPEDLLRAMHEAKSRGATVSACVAWLKKKRGIISESSVGAHFRKGHTV